MKTTFASILALAEERGCAIPAFNVYNLETLTGVMQAAEQTGAPVIFQMYSRLFDGGQAELMAPVIEKAIEKLSVPAVFHLDHGAGLPQAMRAVRCGATGIMIDASTLPFAENIAKTKLVVELAAANGIGVEGELGHVGTTQDETMAEFTKAEDAARFAEETGVTALAVMVGTAHGHYKKAPVLAIDRIAEIHAATKAHLVLHGGSGVPDEQVRAAIKAGIRKVNFGTDVCCSFLDGVFAADRSVYALDLFMRAPVDAVRAYAAGRIELLGAATR